MATLYVVATPIGNLEDITLRALRILKEVQVIACEDTRVTKKLLQKYDISTPTISYPADSARTNSSVSFDNKIQHILDVLEDGKSVALVTDAGTPAISDPGFMLVSRVKEKFGKEVPIISIPGPSALTAALSIAGIGSSDFVFLGFLPHKKGRETLFKMIRDSERAIVFYESPHRIEKSLESLKQNLTLDQKRPRKIVVCRELTKIFEEVVEGNAEEVAQYFSNNSDKVRGEFVVIVGA